jgi:hypothetical protein
MYQGVERRVTRRHHTLKPGLIALERNSLQCMIWDFSPAGVVLFMLDFDKVPRAFDLIFDDLPAEFGLTFDHAPRHCVSVWREFNRIGARYKATWAAGRLANARAR